MRIAAEDEDVCKGCRRNCSIPVSKMYIAYLSKACMGWEPEYCLKVENELEEHEEVL